ncbi:hypothetical protein SAMN05660691_04125 [Rheinheimera pacifica]|uniref:Uncharacterized protein n=1 Tax=Rheinheimera pacifica TaxID=173990 RepID=A0A1H6NEU3_9GAMM|nr:hypothetical protein SAMN05660691_04125 [Rheinheimera pacifica]
MDLLKAGMLLFSRHAYNNRHQNATAWLDSQQVTRVCGGRYV